ncbi:glycosyltransferase involved in cell wall biosynthesis [Duganella sp. 1411]|uniref:glycosyltransferase n=1 Tax=Duganella sp. 1411 TaxID=2806572 RepID=UPI001AEB9B23|nr:glycosyltransferase [Duganella sp. 1411]MBP1206775.1 glycosyltransferase involved in cell wall biosynthesis [Duganella sp. 1411]
MRIVIDLQGAQSESRFRGIGRYSLALALGVARNAGGHEIWLLLNGALGDAIGELRHAFAGLVPPERICVFDVPAGLAERDPGHGGRARAAELVREYALARLQPDAVLVTSLFEGFVDDAVVSVGRFAGAERTAVVLYDLIPFLNPDAYLGTPAQRDYYARKIASLRSAGLLLAISDYSRQEAIEALGLAPESVAAISTAVDDSFRPDAPDAARWAALRARLGVTRAPVMYAPGGFDARKNIDGLITAYGLLAPALRAGHQLLVASKLGAEDRARLLAHAARAGLAADELILTGYVSDDDLIELYRNAALFVFPSRHEGFGLPALEAMACGALVIGADNTSIPEVIGCAEALFDAASPAAIAAKIAEVLGDAALRERLRAHGRAQAARFSWDATAQRALRALERWQAPAGAGSDIAPGSATNPDAAAAPARPRLAFVSPLPPERTGIADYAVQLLPALARHFDIELVLRQEQLALPAELAALPRRDVAWFDAHAGEFDQILYQFGNSPFHSHMFELLRRHPGVVVLHDFFLSSVLAYDQMTGAAPGAWARALFDSHGYPALLAGQRADHFEAARDLYPCNLAVLQDATRVIVHSEHARTLARHWYGEQAAANWDVVPLPRARPARHDRDGARRALGIADDAFLVCSFGFIAPTKLTLELVAAWRASRLHADPRCVLVLVGANHGGDYGVEVDAAIAAAGGERIRIAGWTDEAVYHQYLQAADAGVQLRSVSRGETSAAVLDCMNYGLATIVNANGSMAALPADAVWPLPDRFAPAQLTAALEALHGEPARRAALGAAAATLLHTEHSPEHGAALYAAALARAARDARQDRPALLRALAARDDLPADDASLQQLAACVARAPDPTQPRQLLLDVTAIARHDLKTGIERVVRNQARELLRAALPGWRVEPVYLSDEGGRWHYRYARRYTASLLGIAGEFADPAADSAAGDVFYSADYAPGAVMAAAGAGLYAHWRARGVQVNFLVHDLLPVLRPEFFPDGAALTHGGFLDCVAASGDRLIAISGAVRDELRQWLARRDGVPTPRLAVLHHGADIGAGQPAAPAPDDPALARFAELPSFLMVGTIEPRKGHLQALDAFEKLWADGVEANLVIVGAEGWKPLPGPARRTIPQIVRRLREHPELGRRLFWLQDLDDHALQQLYRDCACLLVPSEGEGFGLPLIEAARQGLPVLARDLPVFREVAGAHAYYFSGLDGVALAAAVRAWLALDADGAAPPSAGMPRLTWADNAAELLQVLQGRRD